ncbi:MAG TPA: YqiA/YcfP family alpha/beta fold hydrolase [Vicinamibacterales bacterium]|nr:YqiA/YcfP family alpha/beta fold hydrolase [Vicinamibacterales bacterium]
MQVFYLHGFASSAKSSKAAFLASHLSRHGIELHTPDFNEPDFSTLTITRMIRQVCAEIDARSDDPSVLIGSSLGAFVAVQAALRRSRQVERLILFAPALDFGGNRMRSLGDRGIEEWRRTDRLDVFHYGYGRVLPVHYELFADARQYDSMNASLSMPIQVFQGRQDTAVDPDVVERWSRARSENVELHLLDDDHQLMNSLEFIWAEVVRFLGLRSGTGTGH